MNTIECIKTRRSIRQFKSQKVEHALLEEIIGSASFAPSWKNTQIVRYSCIEDEKILDQIKDNYLPSYNAKILETAPQLLAVTFIKERSGYERDGSYSTPKEDRWQMFDAGIACQTFCLAAHEKGIGSVILGIFEEAEITRLLEIPETEELAALIPIGYADTDPEAPKRKSTEILLSYK